MKGGAERMVSVDADDEQIALRNDLAQGACRGPFGPDGLDGESWDAGAQSSLDCSSRRRASSRSERSGLEAVTICTRAGRRDTRSVTQSSADSAAGLPSYPRTTPSMGVLLRNRGRG